MKPQPCRQQLETEPYGYRVEIEREVTRVLTFLPLGVDCRNVIRTISRLLRLSLLECSMLCWLLSSETSLQEFYDISKEITLYPRKKERALFLLLLVNGYHVKAYLSRGGSNILIDADLLAAVPDFSAIYQSWQPKSDLSSLGLSELNKVFYRLSEEEGDGRKDYNHMVGHILQLSKSYNIGGNRKNHREDSNKQKDEEPRQNQLDYFQPSQFPQFLGLPGGKCEESEQVMVLRVSSGRYRVKDFNLMDLNESRNPFESRKSSEPSIYGSGQKPKGIKPTYSFFDDI